MSRAGAAAALLLAALAGLPAAFAGEVVDDRGRHFEFAQPAARIVSLLPSLSESVCVLDGCGRLEVFFRIVLPLLKPVAVTVIVVQSVAIFNDFTNPLYYLPGAKNATVQLTLFNFQSMFNTSYNLLFMNILLITIPPLIMFLFFNRQIVEGMTAGAVKG